MANRTFEFSLPCGCMLSFSGGGGLIPCYAEYGDFRKKATKEAWKLHVKSWKEYRKSKEFKEHQKEINRRQN